MNKIFINKVTFFLNLIVFIILCGYTIISFFKTDNERSLVEKTNPDLKKKLIPMNIDNAISIEDLELPEIKKNKISEPSLLTVNPVIKVSQKKIVSITPIIPKNTNDKDKEKLKITKINLLKITSHDYKKNNHISKLEPIKNNNNLEKKNFFTKY